MTQLDMFGESTSNGKRTLEVRKELTQFEETTLAIEYADTYITQRGLGKKIDGKWVYKEDKYKLLHYLAQFGLGKKQSIAGWELSSVMFNTKNTEKLRGMINELRNDNQIDLIIGSSANGYFIARHKEVYEAVKYIFGKSVNEMITAIKMYPPLAESYIKIAQMTYQNCDKSVDSQITAQFDALTDEILNEIVIRYADTMKYESKKLLDNILT